MIYTKLCYNFIQLFESHFYNRRMKYLAQIAYHLLKNKFEIRVTKMSQRILNRWTNDDLILTTFNECIAMSFNALFDDCNAFIENWLKLNDWFLLSDVIRKKHWILAKNDITFAFIRFLIRFYSETQRNAMQRIFKVITMQCITLHMCCVVLHKIKFWSTNKNQISNNLIAFA